MTSIQRKSLETGHRCEILALVLFPIDAFGGLEAKEGRGRLEKQVAWLLRGNCSATPPSLPHSPGPALTWDFPPAPSTARVTERAQQMTWILKKEPKKLLQPRAIISCGHRIGSWGWGAGYRPNTVVLASWILNFRVTLLL